MEIKEALKAVEIIQINRLIKQGKEIESFDVCINESNMIETHIKFKDGIMKDESICLDSLIQYLKQKK